MKKTKKIFACCLSIMLLFTSFIVNVEASTNATLTVEEYSSEIQKFCANYGVQCQLSDFDDSQILTRDMLNEDLTALKKVFSSSIAEDEMNTPEPKTISLRAMIITQNLYAYKTVSNALGNMQLAIKANVTENVQSADLVNLNYVSSYANGYGINFDSWTQTSWRQNLAIELLPRTFSCHVEGQLSCSYTLPGSNVKTNCTTTHKFDVTIKLT